MFALLMHGLRAFNLYMPVERERWQGTPITRQTPFDRTIRTFISG